MNDKAAKTLKLLQEGLQDGQCACLPDMLRMIYDLSSKFKDLAVTELADLIKNDTVVLERIVAAANKIGYNPSGYPIANVAEAIQVIGFDRVRSLSMSLILLENSNMWQYSDERRNATMTSLTSGLMSEQFSRYVYEVHPELAFLAGALRGFGLIVLTTYLLDDFRKIPNALTGMAEAAHFREQFGLTPIEIGKELMKASNMSPVLLDTLQDYDPSLYRKRTQPPEIHLRAVSDLAYKLSQCAIRTDVSEAAFRNFLATTKEEYVQIKDLSFDDVDSILVRTNRHLRAIATGSSKSAFSREAIRNFRCRADHSDPPQPFELSAVSLQKKSFPSPLTFSSSEHLSKGLEQMRFWETGGKPVDRGIIHELLNTLSKGLNAPECWAFLPRPNSNTFSFRLGIGTHSILLQERVHIHPRENTLFSLCLARKERIYIHDARQPKVRSHLPKWFIHNVQLNSFILMCLQKSNRPAGVIFVGWPNPRDIHVDPSDLGLISEMLDLFSRLAPEKNLAHS